MQHTQRSLVPARGKSSRTASYCHYLYLSLKGGAESSQFQDHAQSPIYLFTVTRRERAHMIIHNQKINTTSVSKPEVLFVFLFACLGPIKWLLGAISSSCSLIPRPHFPSLKGWKHRTSAWGTTGWLPVVTVSVSLGATPVESTPTPAACPLSLAQEAPHTILGLTAAFLIRLKRRAEGPDHQS